MLRYDTYLFLNIIAIYVCIIVKQMRFDICYNKETNEWMNESNLYQRKQKKF